MKKLLFVFVLVLFVAPVFAQIGGMPFSTLVTSVSTKPITISETAGLTYNYFFYDGWVVNLTTYPVCIAVYSASTTQTCVNFSSAGKILEGEMVYLSGLYDAASIDLKGKKIQNFSVALTTHGCFTPALGNGGVSGTEYIINDAAINDKIRGWIHYRKEAL